MSDVLEEIGNDLVNSRSQIENGFVFLGSAAIGISMAGSEYADRQGSKAKSQAVVDCLNLLVAKVVNGDLHGYDPNTVLPLELLDKSIDRSEIRPERAITHKTLLRIEELRDWGKTNHIVGLLQFLDEIGPPHPVEVRGVQTTSILPRYSTISEAVIWISRQTKCQWSENQLLDAAASYGITLHAGAPISQRAAVCEIDLEGLRNKSNHKGVKVKHWTGWGMVKLFPIHIAHPSSTVTAARV